MNEIEDKSSSTEKPDDVSMKCGDKKKPKKKGAIPISPRSKSARRRKEIL